MLINNNSSTAYGRLLYKPGVVLIRRRSCLSIAGGCGVGAEDQEFLGIVKAGSGDDE